MMKIMEKALIYLIYKSMNRFKKYRIKNKMNSII